MKTLFCSLIATAIFFCSANAQDFCDQFNTLFKRVDSLAEIAKQHRGDTSFQRHTIFPQYKNLQLDGITADVSAGWIVFQFNEQKTPLAFANLEMCVERYLNEHKLYVKHIKAEQQTKVYASKKETDPIFFIGKGTLLTKEGKIDRQAPYLFIRYYLYP